MHLLIDVSFDDPKQEMGELGVQIKIFDKVLDQRGSLT